MRQGGYPKRPAPLPSLVIPLTFENLKSIDTIKSIYAYRKICILLALPYMDRTIKIPHGDELKVGKKVDELLH